VLAKYNEIFITSSFLLANSALVITELNSTKITSGTASLLRVAFNYYFIIKLAVSSKSVSAHLW
jgi:hypothetical protein